MRNPDKERIHVERLISERRLGEAIERLRILMPARHWELNEELQRVADDYVLMRNFAVSSGQVDPHLPELYGKLMRRLRRILYRIVRLTLSEDSPSLYFSTLRYEQTRPSDTVAALIADYRHRMGGSSLLERSTGTGQGAQTFTDTDREAAERRIFNRLWTTFPLSPTDSEAIMALVSDQTVPDRLAATLPAALMLGSLDYPDETALCLLLDIALTQEAPMEVRLRAAACALMLIGLDRNGDFDSPKIGQRLESLAETDFWPTTARTVWQQFFRSKSTAKIDKDLRQDLYKSFSKFKENMPGQVNFLDPDALSEINPEWEEIMKSSGLGKKIEEFSQLASEGADVNHAMFGSMKNFPFFNDPAHWFMPFDPDHSSVRGQVKAAASLQSLILATSQMCDSDKYSLAFSFSHLPTQMLESMSRNFDDVDGIAARMSGAKEWGTASGQERDILKYYLQDIYRFYLHFRRKEEFDNPFRGIIDLSGLLADDAETLRTVGELCFKLGYYDEALSLFDKLHDDSDPILLQKKGYALQHSGRLQEALDAFLKADIIKPDSVYTLKRIAALHRAMGHYDKAIEYYRQVQTLRPDDASAALAEGHAQLDAKRYREALHCYYKAEFTDENSLKPLRPIAWVTFLMKDFDTSLKYYQRLMAEATPEPNDYLNMGHLHLALRNPREALNYYRLFAGGDANRLREAVKTDMPMLAEAGIDQTLIPLILDSL